MLADIFTNKQNHTHPLTSAHETFQDLIYTKKQFCVNIYQYSLTEDMLKMLK